MEVVKSKSQTNYLQGYFEDLRAQTIVVENDYVDRDYLEDYAGYYVRCFHNYGSHCRRLHFFKNSFNEHQFADLLIQGTEVTSDTKAILKQENYLGFIVVKPLPLTVYGRTCLQTYPEDGRRHYPVRRSYSANLFGIPLTVADTLAFQEQDTVTAACATSALWSAFQGTGILFHHQIPSPVEITRAALSRFPVDERAFPNRGLYDWQMAHAIRSVGLEPVRLRAQQDLDDIDLLKSTIYAYVNGGIPALLGVHLWELNPDKPRSLGLHAVAVTGFSLGGNLQPCADTGLVLTTTRMDKIYAHDDGVGPFARMEFIQTDSLGDPPKKVVLTTSWSDTNGVTGKVIALPEILMLPLYHKIRIPFRTVLVAVASFDIYIRSLAEQGITPLSEQLEWDIHLTTVESFKNRVWHSGLLEPAYLLDVLTQPMPKFIWKATAQCRGANVLDLVFDATDIDQGKFFVRAIEYDPVYKYVLRAAAHSPALTKQPKTKPVWAVLQWFADQPVEL